MHLVNKEMGSSMCKMVIGKVDKTMLSKPKVIKGNVERLGRTKLMCLQILKHHGCLTYATCPSNTKHSDIPVNGVVHVTKET